VRVVYRRHTQFSADGQRGRAAKFSMGCHRTTRVVQFIRRTLVCIVVVFLALLIHSLATFLSRSVTIIGGIDTLLVTIFAFLTSRLFTGAVLSRGALVADVAMLIFFSALGGSVQLSGSIVVATIPIFLVCFITLICHGVSMLLAYYILRLPLPEILVSSNALIGGSSTAAFFAGSQGWTHLLGPAITIGSVGYGIATPIALLLLKVVNNFGF